MSSKSGSVLKSPVKGEIYTLAQIYQDLIMSGMANLFIPVGASRYLVHDKDLSVDQLLDIPGLSDSKWICAASLKGTGSIFGSCHDEETCLKWFVIKPDHEGYDYHVTPKIAS